MTADELNELLAELNNYKVTLSNSKKNFKKDLVGIENVKVFIENENEFWSVFNNIPSKVTEITTSRNKFKSIKKSIEDIYQYLSLNVPQTKDAASEIIKNQLTGIKSELNTRNLLFSTFYERKLYRNVAISSPNNLFGAYSYFNQTNNFNPTIKDDLVGFIKAYEYDLNGFSELTNRSKIELEALGKIQKKLENKIEGANEYEKHIIEEFKNIFADVSSKKEVIEKEYESFKLAKIAEHDELKQAFTKRFEEQLNEINNSHAQKVQQLKTLEDTYNDKLQLETPIKYWEGLSNKYRMTGFVWFAFSIICIIGLGFYFYQLYTKFPDVFTQIKGTTDFKFNPNSIRQIFTFLTVVSFGAYFLRLLFKLSFSSFHLQRDAIERKQLTLVYLALLKEGTHKVNDKDKEIILQALFSRAETGLLNVDGSPTMPGLSLIDKLPKQ